METHIRLSSFFRLNHKSSCIKTDLKKAAKSIKSITNPEGPNPHTTAKILRNNAG